MKIKETRYPDGQGFGGVGRKETRVRDLGDNEAMPPNSHQVDDAAEIRDWEEDK